MRDESGTRNQYTQLPIKEKGLLFLLIAIGVAGRLLPHLPNATPIGGLTIWGSTRLKRVQALTVVLGSMILSDLYLGWHTTVFYVYGSLILIALLGSMIKKITIPTVAGFTILGSVVFFLITNFGVWQAGTMYPHTFSGLLSCYVAALPFFRASLTSDIVYTAIFFTLEFLTSKATAKMSHRKAVTTTH